MKSIQPFCGVMKNQNSQDPTPCYYICQTIIGSWSALGLIVAMPLENITNGKVLEHEAILHKKKVQYVDSFRKTGAQINPVLLTYKNEPDIEQNVKAIVASRKPHLSYSTNDSLQNEHRIWVVSDSALIADITKLYCKINQFYIADGHHRAAALMDVYKEKKDICYLPNFLAYLVPDSNINVKGFNKLLRSLHHYSDQIFLTKLANIFSVKLHDSKLDIPKDHCNLYLGRRWYTLYPKHAYKNHQAVLPALINDFLYESVFDDTKKLFEDSVDSIGHNEPVEDLEDIVNQGIYKAAFYIPSLTIDDFFTLVNEKRILPPNTTCFEPKITHGIVSMKFPIQVEMVAV